jgi:hypothetical protein
VLSNHGEPGGTRTRDHRIKSAMLYQLNYRPTAGHNKLPQNSKRAGSLGLQSTLQSASANRQWLSTQVFTG